MCIAYGEEGRIVDNTPMDVSGVYERGMEPRTEWPDWLFETERSALSLEDMDRLRYQIGATGELTDGSIDAKEDALYPRRLLLVDYRGATAPDSS